jgi:regulator of protease activity HflC (stomatin/prohibitin superfamily)
MTEQAQQQTAIVSTLTQRPARPLPGAPAVVAAVVGFAGGVVLITAGGSDKPLLPGLGIALIVLVVLLWAGFTVVQPNESKVLIAFGRYTGTVLEPGLWWVNPFTALWRQTISLRVRNFQGAKIKVNDASGNPIEIAAVIVWRVVDTAKAVFDVENFESFVVIQSETAVRHLASQFPYDDYAEGTISLRRNTDEVMQALVGELQQRLAPAGIDVLETRVTHLAYAAEIAEVMLRRQQAEAIVAARRTMVTGAVGLVQMAIEELEGSDTLDLDPERKAAMAANLMVVLSGDHSPSPVINTGSLYT